MLFMRRFKIDSRARREKPKQNKVNIFIRSVDHSFCWHVLLAAAKEVLRDLMDTDRSAWMERGRSASSLAVVAT
jgi:hypothetical protein